LILKKALKTILLPIFFQKNTTKIFFEKVDTRQYDENYCKMEWFTPVTEKTA